MAMSDSKTIELISPHTATPLAYGIAGIRLVTNYFIPALVHYQKDELPEFSRNFRIPEPGVKKTIFTGEGLIGGDLRRIACETSESGFWLTIQDIARYWVSPEGYRIAQLTRNIDCDDETLAIVALGVPLVLALAINSCFCLHASVVTFKQGTVLFIGESGQGKSTLARFLGEDGNSGWQRIIDDTLPIRIKNNGQAAAFPHFPQLKLHEKMQQPSQLVPERMPIHVIYNLDQADDVGISSLSRRDATLALVQHTVGGRLFDRALLADHLAFCSEVARTVPVRRLVYRHDYALLPEVVSALRRDLEQLTH
jgi:hypothetical protein